jgi:hypothetical protein
MWPRLLAIEFVSATKLDSCLDLYRFCSTYASYLLHLLDATVVQFIQT